MKIDSIDHGSPAVIPQKAFFADIRSLAAGVIMMLLCWSVYAQTLPNDPPLRTLVDERDVDLVTGTPQRKFPVISIGRADQNGLATDLKLDHGASLDGWIDTSDGHAFFAIVNDHNYAFVNTSWTTNGQLLGPGIINGFNFVSSGGDNATLTRNGNTWTLVTPQGDTAVYTDVLNRGLPATGPANAGANLNLPGTPFVQLSTLTRANGERLTVYHVPVTSGTVSYAQRVAVANNSGYQIKTAATGYTAINAAVDACDPSAATCSGLTQARTTSIDSSVNNQTSIIDAASRRRTYIWTGGRFIGQFIMASGRTETTTDYAYVYQTGSSPPQSITFNRILSWSNVSNKWTYSYADSNQATATIVTVTDPLGKTRVVNISRPLSIWVAAGTIPHKPHVNYDTDELGRTTTYSYDNYDRITLIAFPEGDSVGYQFDQWGNRTQVTWTAKPGSGLANVVTHANFDANCPSQITCSHPVYTIDALGNRTDYTYDPVYGVVLTKTDPIPSAGAPRPQTRYSYTALYAWYKNASGTIVQSPTAIYKLTGISTCLSGSSCVGTSYEKRTVISYGTPGTPNNLLPTSIIMMSGDGAIVATTAMSYNAFGDLIAVDGPLPGTADTTRSFYDVVRQLLGVAQPDPDGTGPLPSPATRTTYDVDGRSTLVERGTLRASAPDLSTFNSLDQLATAYDSIGRKVSDTHTAGGTAYEMKQYSYDTADRQLCTAERMNSAGYAAPPASACTLGTAGLFGPDRITHFIYDDAGQLLKVQKAYGTPIQQDYATYTYSLNGRRLSVTDANGNLATMSYDGFDREVQWTFPSKTTTGQVNGADYEQYGYDANGNRTSQRKRDGRVLSFGYDGLNRMTTKTSPSGNVTYGYDLQGHQLTALFTASGQGVQNTYDALGRQISTASTMGGVNRMLTFQYDLADGRVRVSHSDGNYFVYDRDAIDRIIDIRENGNSILATLSYEASGRRSGISRANAASTSFNYDGVGRLATLSHDLSGTASDVIMTYGRNPADQLTSFTRSNSAYAWTGSANANTSYSTNGLNEYTTVGSLTPSYDANANLLSDGTTTYGYDVENRLTSATGAHTANLIYDPLGRLFQVSGGTGGVQQFLYDGDALAEEFDGSGTVLRRYVTGSNSDETLIWYEGTALTDRRYLHHDHQGSIIATSNATGAASVFDTYDEYGIPGINNAGRFQYTGQAWIPELGLYHYKARAYSPTLGRFMQTDPVGYADEIDLYTYTGNDPLDKTDPKGLSGCQSGDKLFTTCMINIVYDPETSKGTLTVSGQNKGDKSPTTLLTSNVVVGGDGHVTPAGTFTASYWEKDHVSTKYGSWADTPYSKTKLGGNAFGPYQLHIKELDREGIYIHGTMGPSWNRSTFFNSLVSPTSHGCVRMCNADDIALRNMMPNPSGNKINISKTPEEEEQ